jgi:hypothetical protein
VEDDLDPGIGQELADRRETAGRERVHDHRLAARRDLEQVDPVEVAVKARRLGIHRQQRLFPQPPGELRQRGFGLDH